METPTNNPWLPRLAKFCVLATLALILLGGMVTTGGYGMAFQTWPLSDGSINPPGWINKTPQGLEHAHRLVGGIVASSVALLCAMWWQNIVALFIAPICGVLAGIIAYKAGAAAGVFSAIGITVNVSVFTALLLNKRGSGIPHPLRKLALVAVWMVCIQAMLGGLRVLIEANISAPAAMGIRVFHGVLAQVVLALLVVIAVRLCPTWNQICARPPHEKLSKFHRMAIAAQLLYFAQLACAAYLRHNPNGSLGLLIPTWPSAQAAGGFWPDAWATGDGALRHQLMIHFLHTRILPILLTGHIIGMSIGIIKRAKGETFLTTPAKALLTMIVLQFILGVLVIWRGRQSHITNTHVLVGALICATIAMLAARTSRPSAQTAAA